MSKYNGLLRKDTPGGMKALEQIQGMKVGDVFEDGLFPAIPEKVKWTCIEHLIPAGDDLAESWMLAGRFCDVPLYDVVIRIEGNNMTMNVKDVE